jgi:hypothetical protein
VPGLAAGRPPRTTATPWRLPKTEISGPTWWMAHSRGLKVTPRTKITSITLGPKPIPMQTDPLSPPAGVEDPSYDLRKTN